MANDTSSTGNAPAQPTAYRVLVIDNYHVPDDDAAHSVGPFPTWEQAVEYARRRTWDSVEECRETDPHPDSLRRQFFMFGESCSAYGGEGKHYSARDELDYFVAHPATKEQRSWSELRPRADDVAATGS
jgi:hypothetical protein